MILVEILQEEIFFMPLWMEEQEKEFNMVLFLRFMFC
jgi:hypothetical protein